jgi:hypothetical protein
MRFGTEILPVHAPEASREFVFDWGSGVNSPHKTVSAKTVFCGNRVGAEVA